MVPLKDEMLSRLAAQANVAQFVSFGPGPGLPQRHSCLRGHRPDHRFGDAAQQAAACDQYSGGSTVPAVRLACARTSTARSSVLEGMHAQ